MKIHILFLLLYIGVYTMYSQTKDSIASAKSEEFLYLVEGDTIPVEAIALNEVFILDKIEFDNKAAYRKYYILRRKTRKVYPYAKMAADTLSNIVADLKDIKKKRKRKKYIKQMQKFMEDRFTPELKKLTRTEGQILVKLIHRQTNETMYNLIKDYRSGFKAFVYDTTAHLFNISLKKKFEPTIVYEDYLIEDILQRSFQDNILQRQPPAVYVPFIELIDKWGDFEWDLEE